ERDYSEWDTSMDRMLYHKAKVSIIVLCNVINFYPYMKILYNVAIRILIVSLLYDRPIGRLIPHLLPIINDREEGRDIYCRNIPYTHNRDYVYKASHDGTIM
ncbi:unnamed protein product, partial [Dovyalis caffra]